MGILSTNPICTAYSASLNYISGICNLAGVPAFGGLTSYGTLYSTNFYDPNYYWAQLDCIKMAARQQDTL